MKRHPNIECHAVFHADRNTPRTLEADLAGLFQLREHLRTCSPTMARWYLGGKAKEEAPPQEAFDERGLTPQVLAALKEKVRRRGPPTVSHGAGLWNGDDSPQGASMLLFASLVDVPSFFRFSTGSPPLLAYDKVLATALKIVELWNPLHLSVGPCRYDGVFMDRPEAGWMLYLPRPLSPQQVPEAHTLVPVMKPDATGQPQQTGTVVVSIDDGPFSEENPAHVKRAHDIEIRLAAQGLLPRFGDPPPPR